ncbi:MAG: hypothetical protein WAQ08_05845 [Aquabacterium sp.]|uniref:hypothetical protein n=1 Tax=Aquabacterium sp. TaxID=1872578 RepID=UPI003BB0EEFF
MVDFADQFGISLGSAETAGFGSGVYSLESDIRDAYQVAPYQGGDSASPWWQNLVLYGAVRAIDNQFGAPATVYGNTSPGTFAGQNGKSYYANGRPTTVQAGILPSLDASFGGMGGLLLLAVFAFVVMNAGGGD